MYIPSAATDEFNTTFDVCRLFSIVPPVVAQLPRMHSWTYSGILTDSDSVSDTD